MRSFKYFLGRKIGKAVARGARRFANALDGGERPGLRPENTTVTIGGNVLERRILRGVGTFHAGSPASDAYHRERLKMDISNKLQGEVCGAILWEEVNYHTEIEIRGSLVVFVKP